jgi:hypothetical protein
MKTNKVFKVIVHYSNYLNDRMISFNTKKEYNFVSDNDLVARELAVRYLIDEWKAFNRATLQEHLIEVLYCETTLACYLD